MANNIKSTMVSGEYLDSLIDKTMDEIINLMSNVFGPKGTDLFINSGRDGNLYFTRDGREVFQSLSFDNPLSQQIRDLISQAVENQASTIGDSTTTVALLIPKIIKELRKSLESEKQKNSIFDLKRMSKELTSKLRELIKKEKIEMEYGSAINRSLIYTTTGDMKFADMIFENIPEIKGDSFIDVRTNENVNETSFEISGIPKIKTSILYSKRPLRKAKEAEHYVLTNSIVLFVDGTLSLFKPEVVFLLSLLSAHGADNVVILCPSMDKTTNDTLRGVNAKYSSILSEEQFKTLANIVVLKLPEYINMQRDEILDVNTLVYDTARDINVGQAFDFEHKLYHALQSVHSVIPELGKLVDLCKCEDYEVYDGDEELLTIFKDTMFTHHRLELSDKELLMPPRETVERVERIKAIKEGIEKTRSPIEATRLAKRLDRFYSSKIIVKVGSQLLAHAQKDTELLLDALKATKSAVGNGCINTNGLSLLREKLMDLNDTTNFSQILLKKTEELLDMIYPGDLYGSIYFNGGYYSEVTIYEHVTSIYEPIDAIIKVIDAIDLAIDIAYSNVYTTKSFLNNYI